MAAALTQKTMNRKATRKVHVVFICAILQAALKRESSEEFHCSKNEVPVTAGPENPRRKE